MLCLLELVSPASFSYNLVIGIFIEVVLMTRDLGMARLFTYQMCAAASFSLGPLLPPLVCP